MTQYLRPDICVIGGGSGGLSVAAGAAAFGVSVVLVEEGAMGGDCLNHGCVPSKALIAASRRAQAMRTADDFGIERVDPGVDFRKVGAHVADVIASIAPNDSEGRFAALGVSVIKAHGRFKDARTLVAGDVEIRARRFVIATGSSPALPAIPGLDTVDVLTNETVFGLARLPRHLAIIGGGPIGIELAQAFRRLGSAVTVIEAHNALGREDPEMAAVVLAALRREGVDLVENAAVSHVERRGKTGVRIHVERDGRTSSLDASHLLIAVGRVANLDGLDLESAGIAHDGDRLKMTPGLRTTNRRVYAVGDVVGPPHFTHLANHHAGIVLRAILFRLKARADRTPIPRATFSDPELAHVGMTEMEARGAGETVRILRWPLAENDRARTERASAGHIKLIAGRGGRILGVSIVGAGASEMIGMWTLAVSKELRLRDIAGLVLPYPTMGEIGKRAAITYLAGAARNRLVRLIVGALRRFG